MRNVLGLTITLTACLTVTGAVADGETTTALTTEGIDAQETTFGDLTTDGIADAAGTTIALAPAVIFKPGEIAPGPVTVAAVSALLHDPDETWAVIRLTGAQLRATLERAVSFAPTPRVFFLQVSGLTVVYDPDAPRGRKVRSLTVGSAPVDETETYEVAMPESLADGGSGYFTIFEDAPRVRTGTRGLAEVIRDYVAARESVSYTGLGRIVVGS